MITFSANFQPVIAYCFSFRSDFFFFVLKSANFVEEMLETRHSPTPSDPHICTALKVAYCIVSNTGLVKIMLTLMDYFSPADRRTPWVTH
jgi:hypothetical protein